MNFHFQKWLSWNILHIFYILSRWFEPFALYFMNCDLQTENPLLFVEIIVRWFCPPPREWWQKSMLILWVDLCYTTSTALSSLCVSTTYIRLWSTSTVGVLCVMAAAVLRSRLPDWEFGQIFGSSSVCGFDLWGVAAHFNSIFTSFLTENDRVNGFAWLTFF